METCLRGFSFMPENKVEVVDLKYVEGSDLERTWKATRRERLKHQEEKIWEEFVKEKDIVHSMCKDDPYQFVDQLPQECIKELLDIELEKMKQEKMEEIELPPSQVVVEPPDNQHVTFAEESEEDMFCIFDEDRDDDVSGPEEEMLNESLSPPLTVRERDVPSPKKTSADGKSSNENVTNIIEGSIYCAKVKELRLKMIDEMNNIISFLECVDILNLEPEDATKILRRAAEFSIRYGRVHLYQLHRQISDIERHNENALPFAARTHFQAQLCRVTSLHNNLLQALQVYFKSLPQTLGVRESGVALSSLAALVSRASQAGERAPPPSLNAAQGLCSDAVQETCDKLVETLNEYTAKMTDYLNSTENTSVTQSNISTKKRSTGTWSRSGKSLLSCTDARLSMYSIDTRLTLNKSISSKDHSSGTSKRHGSIIMRTKQAVAKEELPTKSSKKSPRHRRPLMRAPGSHSVRPRAPRDQDVRTLVETVPCASSHISRDVSPLPSPGKTEASRRNSREATPRKLKDKRKSLNNTPRCRLQSGSPKLDSNKSKETSRSPKERPQTVEPFRNNDLDSSRNKKKSPVKELVETKNNEVQIVDEVKSPKLNIETANTIEKKEMGEVKSPEVNIKTGNTIEKKEMGEEKIKKEKDKLKSPEHQMGPGSCEVTRLLRQLCGGDAVGRSEKISGAKNAQLLCMSGGSPRPPSTPQLLRILEETIQKKSPKPLFPKPPLSARDKERYRMTFNIPEKVTENMFQYRTKFVQYMLSSALYANSAVGKPWEKIGRVSEKIIDELLLDCAKEMELRGFVKDLYKSETS